MAPAQRWCRGPGLVDGNACTQQLGWTCVGLLRFSNCITWSRAEPWLKCCCQNIEAQEYMQLPRQGKRVRKVLMYQVQTFFGEKRTAFQGPNSFGVKYKITFGQRSMHLAREVGCCKAPISLDERSTAIQHFKALILARG
eukprot:scaffold7892_cov17-Tisochrysis_lutea.AAC.2